MITFNNKTTLNSQPDIANENKVTASDMNEIKSVYNTEIGDVTDLDTTDKTSVVNAINELKDGEIYSTNEVKTNKIWIDGKPIYRKVLKFNNVPTGLTQKNHGISNFDKLIKYSGYYYNSTFGYNPIPTLTSDNVSGYGIGIGDFRSTTFYFNIGNLRSSTNEIKLILEYTKTTD